MRKLHVFDTLWLSLYVVLQMLSTLWLANVLSAGGPNLNFSTELVTSTHLVGLPLFAIFMVLLYVKPLITCIAQRITRTGPG